MPDLSKFTFLIIHSVLFKLVSGVNVYMLEDELEVQTTSLVPHPSMARVQRWHN